MELADGVPGFLLPALSRILFRPKSGQVERSTRLSREDWRDLSRRFPMLGPDPGPRAAAARRRIWFLADRALSTARHGWRWEGGRPDPAPAVYLTAHLGYLRALRYALRLEGVPAAIVIAADNIDRAVAPEADARCDRRRPLDFPHSLPSASTHQMRAALRRGSLILTIDGPVSEFVEVPFLGGTIGLDPRPLRLARIAAVPVRAVFMTAPRGRLTVTLGRKMDPMMDPSAALREIGDLLGRVAARSPFDFDAWSHWGPS